MHIHRKHLKQPVACALKGQQTVPHELRRTRRQWRRWTVGVRPRVSAAGSPASCWPDVGEGFGAKLEAPPWKKRQ